MYFIPRFMARNSSRTRYNSFVRHPNNIELGTGPTNKKTFLLACLPGEYTQFSALINSGHLVKEKEKGSYQIHLVLSIEITSYKAIKQEEKKEVKEAKSKIKLEVRKKQKVRAQNNKESEQVSSYEMYEVK